MTNLRISGRSPHRQWQPRRVVGLLAVATAIGSLGLAAGGTAAALLAVSMTGTPAAAGLPLGVLAAGQAGVAMLVARLSSRRGRAAGLILGYATGVVGALVVLGAAAGGGFLVMLAGSGLLGGANAAVFLTRYAAADVGAPEARGRALGTVLFATTAGTVAGPSLLLPSARLAQALGLDPLTGLYLVAVVAFVGAALVLGGLSRGRRPALPKPALPKPALPKPALPKPAMPRGGVAAAPRPARARAALLVLGVTNLVMVAIMAVSPVLLTHHGHHLGFVGLAVTLHVLGMFAPAPLTGWLADRIGGAAVASAGATLLVAAGIGGVLVDPASGPAMAAVLLVLGLGWNCGVVGGSALLTASVPAELRPRSEAAGEASMGLAAAAGAPAAGLLVVLGGFATVCLAGAALAATILAVARRRPARGSARAADPVGQPDDRVDQLGAVQQAGIVVVGAVDPHGLGGATRRGRDREALRRRDYGVAGAVDHHGRHADLREPVGDRVAVPQQRADRQERVVDPPDRREVDER
jgi:MFS family permease